MLQKSKLKILSDNKPRYISAELKSRKIKLVGIREEQPSFPQIHDGLTGSAPFFLDGMPYFETEKSSSNISYSEIKS